MREEAPIHDPSGTYHERQMLTSLTACNHFHRIGWWFEASKLDNVDILTVPLLNTNPILWMSVVKIGPYNKVDNGFSDQYSSCCHVYSTLSVHCEHLSGQQAFAETNTLPIFFDSWNAADGSYCCRCHISHLVMSASLLFVSITLE